MVSWVKTKNLKESTAGLMINQHRQFRLNGRHLLQTGGLQKPPSCYRSSDIRSADKISWPGPQYTDAASTPLHNKQATDLTLVTPACPACDRQCLGHMNSTPMFMCARQWIMTRWMQRRATTSLSLKSCEASTITDSITENISQINQSACLPAILSARQHTSN